MSLNHNFGCFSGVGFGIDGNVMQLGEPWKCTYFRQDAVMYQYGEINDKIK